MDREGTVRMGHVAYVFIRGERSATTAANRIKRSRLAHEGSRRRSGGWLRSEGPPPRQAADEEGRSWRGWRPEKREFPG